MSQVYMLMIHSRKDSLSPRWACMCILVLLPTFPVLYPFVLSVFIFVLSPVSGDLYHWDFRRISLHLVSRNFPSMLSLIRSYHPWTVQEHGRQGYFSSATILTNGTTIAQTSACMDTFGFCLVYAISGRLLGTKLKDMGHVQSLICPSEVSTRGLFGSCPFRFKLWRESHKAGLV
jgi:hypothetical protein